MQKLNEKIIGFTCSTFDLLHAGHVAMLREAKEHCEYLICGLQVDPSYDRPTKNKPSQSLVERFIQLQGVKYVDEIIPYQTETDLEDILNTYPINIRFLGEEYRNTDFTGRDICKKRDIFCYFNKRDHSFSSSSLRKRIFNIELMNEEKRLSANKDLIRSIVDNGNNIHYKPTPISEK
jgi:glycerol-3-phosphate cytidylyltransferase